MAAVVSLLGTATFNTSSGSKTVTAAPAVGDLIVIVVAHSGSTASVAPTDNNSGGGGTYTLVNTAVKATSADTMQIWVRDNLITSATSTVFTHNPGTTTGGGLVVLNLQGMSKTGSLAYVQSAIQSNQASGGTPAPVLGATPSSTNAIIGAVFNASNTATLTQRTSYTELADLGYNAPVTGLEVMSRNSGETSATITWGSTSGSAFASIAVELNTIANLTGNGSLSGAGTVSFTGTRIQIASSSVTGAGTLAATSRVVKFVDSSLSSLGTLVADPKKVGYASFTGTANISSSYIWIQNYDGYRDTEDDNQRITEAGDFRITEKFIDAQVSLNALGILSADGTYIEGNQTYFGEAYFTGTGTLEAQGSPKRYGSGSYSSLGTLSVTPILKYNGAGLFSGIGSISSVGITFKLGLSSLNSNGTLNTSSNRTTYAIVNALANGTKLSVGVRTVFGVIDIHGVHTGTFTPHLILNSSFIGSAVGSLSTTSSFKARGASTLTGTGTLSALGYRVKIGATSLSSSGTMTAKAFDSTMYVKDGSTWKVSTPYVKHNSTWKKPIGIYKNISNVWTRVY